MPRALLVLALVLLAAAPAALADTRDDIIRDCNDDGRLAGDYTPSQIRDARKHIPADVDQYSDCRDVLTRALGGTGKRAVNDGGGGNAGGGGSTGGGTSGGGTAEPATPLTPETPADQEALAGAAAQGGRDPVPVGGQNIVPASAGLVHANPLPDSLVIALVLLALAAAAAAGPTVRRRVVARRSR
jgi:hypothetical protein